MKHSLADALIIRYAEVGLKGKNRSFFENTLIKNIRFFLHSNSLDPRIYKSMGSIIVESGNKVLEGIKNIYGVSSISFANVCDIDDGFMSIKNTIKDLILDISASSFRVSAKRSDKTLPFSSNDVDVAIGSFIAKVTSWKVSLKEFDVDIGIILKERAYIFIEKIKGVGGLPIGVEGKVLCIIEDKSSITDAKMMMKRGCDIELARLADVDISEIKKFHICPSKLVIHDFKDYDQVDKFMKQKDNECKALITKQTKKKDYLVLNPTLSEV